MVSKLKALLVIALCLPLVGAWPNTGKKYPPATSGYTGPGDVVSGATEWWGFRGYTGAIASGGTTAAVNLIRASDSHTCDVLVNTLGKLGNTTNCSTGGDNGTAVATWCNATTCSVTEMYDQTGNANHEIQATAVRQPPIAFSCLGAGSLPCIDNSTGTFLATSTTPTINQPATGASVAERTTGTGLGIIFLGNSSTQYRFDSSANTMLFYAGTATAPTETDAVAHTFGAVYNGASSEMYVDAVGQSESPGTNGLSANTFAQFIVGDSTGSHSITGYFAEGGVWGSAFTGTQATNMCRNQQAFWGSGNFGTAC